MTGAALGSDLRIVLRILDPRLRGWGFPRWGSAASAGLDLHACIDAPLTLAPQAPPVLIPAGFSITIGDAGWCGLVFARSGLGHREGLVLGNAVGVIDADYEGPLLISAWNRNPAAAGEAGVVIAPGDRIAQIVFTRVTRPEFTLVDAFSDREAGIGSPPTEGRRGFGGFGSTGSR